MQPLETRTTIVLAEDAAAIRDLIKYVIAEDSRLEVLGEAADGREALLRVAELQPDVLVLDLSLPVLDGLEVLRELQALPSGPRVVVFSALDRLRMAPIVLELGASAYVEKSEDPSVLLDVIRND